MLNYGNMPLYPSTRPPGDREPCVRVPLFDERPCAPPKLPPVRECRRETFENPRRPGEYVEVLLGLDDCGNLVVCVQRDTRCECECRPRPPCPPRPRPGCLPEPRCGRRRLRGSWDD